MIVKNWTEAPVKPGMSVLHVGKRVSPYQHWEPIYIGTNNVSFYQYQHQEPIYIGTNNVSFNNTNTRNQYTLGQIV